MWPVIFLGLKFEACYFLSGSKMSSNEHSYPNLFRVPPRSVILNAHG